MACSFDLAQEVRAIPTSDTLAQAFACLPWIVAEHHTDNNVEDSHVICVPVTKLSTQLFLSWKPVFIVASTRHAIEVKKPAVEEPSAKRSWRTSTKHPVTSASQSKFNADFLLMNRDFVGLVSVDVEFEKTEDEIWGHLQAKVENARWA